MSDTPKPTYDVPSRRSLLLGGVSAGALLAFGSLPAHGQQARLDFTSPEAFAAAEEAYLSLDAQHNEAGLYAWGEAYYLLGLLTMYETYRDEAYLDQLESRARHVYASTDRARGVSDYSGRSGPVWRASGNYTASHGELTLASGEPGIQVRWAGTASADARATVVAAGDGTFDLELTHPASTQVLTGLSLDPADPNYTVDAVNAVYTTGARWTAIDHRDAHQPGDELADADLAFAPQFYAFAVHTGQVVYPLSRYVRVVHTTPELAHRRPFAGRLRLDIEASVRHHYSDLHIDSEGRGDFRWPLGAPVPFDGLMQPLNQSHALGATYAELYHLTGSQRWRDRVEAILKSLYGGLIVDRDAYIWNYWPVHSELFRGYTADEQLSTYTPSYSATTSWEDISHAAVTLEFVRAVHESGIADLSAERVRFAATYTQNVIRSSNEVWFRVNGTADAAPANAVQSARWLMLSDVEPAIHSHVLSVYEAEPLVPSQGSHALGIAYLNTINA